jgi:hypothetical protein
MSVQDPEEQFEGEQIEDEIEESQNSSIESPLSESDVSTPESIDVPADDEAPVLSSEDSTAKDEDESEGPAVPAIEKLPLSSSDELPPPEPTDGPAWK